MMQLRRMKPSEASAVAPLFLAESQTRFWESGESQDRESASRMLEGYFQLPSRHWILFWNTDIAGYGHVLRSDFLGSWIVSYIVDPQFQGRGLATALVEEAKRYAALGKIESLYASVHPENHASIRVVEKSGFQRTEHLAKSRDNLYRWSSLA
ncbi:MAG: GNAT family N-acetyltransferase [Verrucomicrobiota bacterium]